MYLSERKLAQFDLGKRRQLGNLTKLEGELALPGIGGLKIGPRARADNDKPAPTLDEVIKAIDSSDRASRLFTDEGLSPGEWIRFRSLLSYMITKDLVLFLDSPEHSAATSSGRIRRFLLHGSIQGLDPSGKAYRSDRRVQEDGWPLLGSHFRHLMHVLNHLNESTNKEELNGTGERLLQWYRLRSTIRNLDRELDHEYSAAWMSGYARVTALVQASTGQPVPEVVIATPLFVEYAAPPSTAIALR
jgi:hypothetical protein